MKRNRVTINIQVGNNSNATPLVMKGISCLCGVHGEVLPKIIACFKRRNNCFGHSMSQPLDSGYEEFYQDDLESVITS